MMADLQMFPSWDLWNDNRLSNFIGISIKRLTYDLSTDRSNTLSEIQNLSGWVTSDALRRIVWR